MADALRLELLEREAALARVAHVLSAASAGDGGVLAVESAAGGGKTALLAAATEAAETRNLVVLAAQASDHEREFAFGVVRQLFERSLAEASASRRQELLDGPARNAAAALGLSTPDGPGPSSAESVIHGLYWLVANVSSSHPVLLIVDDVQWADESSWQWLKFLARRVDGLPLGLIVAGRPQTPDTREHSASEVSRLRAEEPIRLEPLTEPAVRRLVEVHLAESPEPEFVRACCELTQGNPFLVIELLRSVTAAVLSPVAASVEALTELSPDRVAWSVMGRLDRLGALPQRVAEALVVLGHGSVEEIAGLAGISVTDAAEGVDLLVASDLVGPAHPFTFIHGLIGKVIHDRISPARLTILNSAAARLIAERKGPADRVASHLLNVPPGADDWVAERLLEAGTAASNHRAYETALTYLKRAAQERVSEPLGTRILSQLGLAEEKLRLPESIGHLAAAIDRCRDVSEAVALVRALGRALALSGRVKEALDVLARGIDRLGDREPDLAWALEIDIHAFGRTVPEGVEPTNRRRLRMIERAQHDPELARRVDHDLLVLAPCWQATDWRESERRVRESLQDNPNPFDGDPESLANYLKVQALGWCDLYDLALEQLELAFDASAACASITGHVIASTYRADVHLRRGAFAEAEADARAALELIDEHRIQFPAALACAWLVMALVERGRASEGWKALSERGFDRTIPEQNVFAMLYGARALLRLAGQDAELALSDALQAGRLLAALGPGPSPLAWRTTAAIAAKQSGRLKQGRQLAEEDLQLARRFGAPRALGISLRTAALVEAGEPLPLLRESVQVLQSAGAPAELSRSLLELGTVMRRRRESVTETRHWLREALDMSHRCGAVVVEQRARDELIAAGGRPRRSATRGVDALTPRELRVAQLAASGATNRQIAQTLFVTPRTIEHHLRSIYGKLGISSRERLAAALAQAEAGDPPDTVRAARAITDGSDGVHRRPPPTEAPSAVGH